MNERRWIRRRPARLAAVLAVAGLIAVAVAISVASASVSGKAGKPTIVLANNSWEGSVANNVVAQYVIEKNLGYSVNLLTIDEIPAWPAMVQGKVSAVMEVWGHSPLYAQYVKGNHKVVDAGLEGPNGNIGWYVPTYLLKAHPELATWKGVKKDWKLFVTPQSSPQGQFLDGSPSYVTNDQALVKNLGLNLKVVFAGTEAAQLTEIESNYKAKKPVLFYWYTPQYQNAIYKFSQVALPPFSAACAKLKPAQINCSYPPYHLYKVMAANLATQAPAVANFIRRFNWTSDDQNSVSYNLAVKHMSNTAAAAAFVNSHQALVKSWLSSSTAPTKVEPPTPGT
ncbi:MAG TPA: glycine betaine ABC transporter substrate-binding protein [Gaiellaceae bacterium]|nr:glycine betaine ABC transporter substrate-binding protein [Gaiellaceae bacterium]